MTRIMLLPTALSLAVAQQAPRFSSDVQLVMVDTQVTEKGTGRVLDLLGPKDFEIYDDGRLRPVKEMHFETNPVDIVFVLYGQGWMSIREVNDYRKGLNLAVDELRPGDRAAVTADDADSKTDLPMTGDREAVRRALLFVKKNSRIHTHLSHPGRLFDALKSAATIFEKARERERRHVIVALTDDLEQHSKTKLEGLITELLESDATLNAVVLVGQSGAVRVGGGIPIPGVPRVNTTVGGSNTSGASIRPAIEATGGEAVPGDLLQDRLPELIRRIRMRYLLGFYAEPEGVRKYHSIEVRLTQEAQSRNPNSIIRARRGYYSEPATK
jgi:VWFA-related protein